LKAAMEKCQHIYKAKLIKIPADLSEESLTDKKAWNDIFQSVRINKHKEKQLMTIKAAMQKILKVRKIQLQIGELSKECI
jgi:hypothetical protein